MVNQTFQSGVVVVRSNPSTQEAEADEVQGHHGLQSEFQVIQGYIERPYLKKKKKDKDGPYSLPCLT